MEKDLFFIKPCRTGGTYEVLPKKDKRYKIFNIERSAKAIDYKIINSTPYVVIVKREYEWSIFPSGRMMVKDLEDKKQIEKFAKELYHSLGNN